MGLGKTLIILAAIVGSLNTSVDFARSGNLQTPTGNINAFAKSSLVVVPSERKAIFTSYSIGITITNLSVTRNLGYRDTQVRLVSLR